MIQLPALHVGIHDKSAQHAELVWDLQKFLLGLGSEIVVDGNFGLKTRKTVQLYQQTKSISTDGVVGPTTWGHLFADGFRPGCFQEADQGCIGSLYGPEKPEGAVSPNGLVLFGKDFKYQPRPLRTMPEYVEVDQGWVREHITTVEVPQLFGIEGAPESGKVSFNRQLVGQLQALFSLIDRRLLLSWAGSYVPRFVRGSKTKLSNHSFGSAFDINAAWNGFRKQPALRGNKGSVREFVLLAYDLGFYWGGWYNDGMHFEAYKVMSEAEVEARA